jgi:hypothetical protein
VPLTPNATVEYNDLDEASDGKVVLTLPEAEEGGYVVTSLLGPQLITEAESSRDFKR